MKAHDPLLVVHCSRPHSPCGGLNNIEISRQYKGITKNAWLKRKRKSYKSQLHHSEIKIARVGALKVKFLLPGGAFAVENHPSILLTENIIAS